MRSACWEAFGFSLSSMKTILSTQRLNDSTTQRLNDSTTQRLNDFKRTHKQTLIVIISLWLGLFASTLLRAATFQDDLVTLPTYSDAGSTDDQVDLVTGEVKWRTLEVSIPGPAGLNLDVYRVRDRSVTLDYLPRWHIDFPYYENYGTRLKNPDSADCENNRPTCLYTVKLEEGIMVNIPGAGRIPFFLSGAGRDTTSATGPLNAMSSTTVGWKAYFTGETPIYKTTYVPLKVLSPTGIEYHFKAGSVVVSDPNGNTLTYTLGQKFELDNVNAADIPVKYSHVKQITASDGRRVDINYDTGVGYRLKSLVVYDTATETRTWTYVTDTSFKWSDRSTYCSSLGLSGERRNECLNKYSHLTGVYIDDDISRVIRPDGKSWQFWYAGNVGFHDTDQNARIVKEAILPTGLKVIYTPAPTNLGGYTHTVGKALYTQSAGAFTLHSSWLYKFNVLWPSETNPSITKHSRTTKTLVSSPVGDTLYTYYSIGDPPVPGGASVLNLLKSITYLDGDRSTQLRTETYAYAPGRNFCQIKPGNLYATPTCQHFSLTRKTIDSVFQTTFADFDPTNWLPKTKTETTSGKSRITRFTYFDQAKNESTGVRHFAGRLASETVEGVGETWVTRRSFNTKGHVTSETVNGITTGFTYFTTGDLNKRTSTNHLGAVTDTLSNYYRGTPRSESLGNGLRTITRSVNPTGTIQWENQGEGHITWFGYDALNRVVAYTPPNLPVVRYDYSDPNQIRVTKDGSGYEKLYLLDSLGQVIATETSGSGIATVYQNFGRDAVGRRVFESYPSYAAHSTLGVATQYDALNRIRTVRTTADGATTSYCYGNACGGGGESTAYRYVVTDPKGYRKVFIKEGFGDPESTWNKYIASDIHNSAADGQPLTSQWLLIQRNLMGDVTSVAVPYDASSLKTYTYYPGTRRLKTITEPERGTVTLTYDAAANLRYKDVPVGSGSQRITYIYDSLNRLKKEDYPAPTTDIDYGYDKANRLTSITRGVISRVYGYRTWGDLDFEQVTVDGRVFTLDYGYNPLGHLESLIYPNNEQILFFPDDWGRPQDVGAFVHDISYHANGQPHTYTYGNGQTVTVAQNSRQFVSGISSSGAGGTPINQTYRFDLSGNITGITDTVNAPATLPRLTYDGLNRLRDADGPWGTGRIDYDAKDNITTRRFGSQTLNYVYSTTTNRLEATTGTQAYVFGYDAQGNVTSNGRHQFSYDLAGRLTAISPTGSQTLPGRPVTIDYLYDGHGYRSLEVRDDRAFYQIHDKGGNLLYETNADGSEQSVYVRFNGQTIAKKDSCANRCTSAQPPAYVPDANGLVVIEAEHYSHRSTAFDGYRWEPITPAGAVGEGAMQVPLGASVAYPVDYVTNGSRLDYPIRFTRTGTHRVWVRGMGPSGTSDTLHIGLDGAAVSSAESLRLYPYNTWGWLSKNMANGKMITIEVNSVGVHTLNLWKRESVAIADRILVTPDLNLVPTGNGPAESIKE